MTKQEKLDAYRDRSPEHLLMCAAGNLVSAVASATRADHDLFWLSDVATYLRQADQYVREFREFVVALDCDDAEAVARMVRSHKAAVDEACAGLGKPLSAAS